MSRRDTLSRREALAIGAMALAVTTVPSAIARAAVTDPVPALCAEWFRGHAAYEQRHLTEYAPLDRQRCETCDRTEKEKLAIAMGEVDERLYAMSNDLDDLQQRIEETRSQTVAGLAAKLRIAALHGNDRVMDYERCASMVLSASLDAEALVAAGGAS